MRLFTPIIAFLMLSAVAAVAQPHEFINAGLRLGWVLGDSGGPVVGIERTVRCSASTTIAATFDCMRAMRRSHRECRSVSKLGRRSA
jgi:hypothetical protein